MPGLRGYKCVILLPCGSPACLIATHRYFGRAKELPGVKELFEQSGALVFPSVLPSKVTLTTRTVAEQAELDSYKTTQASIFDNVDPSYYGEEDDAALVAEERQAELKGALGLTSCPSSGSYARTAWKAQYLAAAEVLEMPDNTPIPPLPEAQYVTLDLANGAADDEPEATTGEKRKAAGGADDEAAAKKSKSEAARGHRFLTVLKAEDLRPPKLPTEADIEVRRTKPISRRSRRDNRTETARRPTARRTHARLPRLEQRVR